MSYKLYYFNARGLAEPIRLILAYGGIEYDDIRVPLESIPGKLPLEIKEKSTWGQVPLMEFEGKKLCQSLAIARYFAKQFGLVPKDDFEAALCDEYVDSSREALFAFAPMIMEKDETKAKELLATIMKTTQEKYLTTFEAIIQANGGQRLVGKDLTWADIHLAHVLKNIEDVNKSDILKEYPGLKALTHAVLSLPKIKAWIEKRPKTNF